MHGYKVIHLNIKHTLQIGRHRRTARYTIQCSLARCSLSDLPETALPKPLLSLWRVPLTALSDMRGGLFHPSVRETCPQQGVMCAADLIITVSPGSTIWYADYY